MDARCRAACGSWLEAFKVRFPRLVFTALLSSNILACADLDSDAPAEVELEGLEQAIVVSIPGLIEAERFERFGDSDTVHEGNCGSGPVDAEVTTDLGGGCNVGWTKPGEWLEYDTRVATTASFTVTARVASAVAGRGFHIEVDGKDVTSRLTAPSAGWQAFEDRVSASFVLSAGDHVVKVVFDDGDVNLNHLTLTAVPGTRAVALPGRFEAEDYTRALELTPAQNSGAACDRGDGVDKESTNDPLGGGCNIGWTDAGESLSYDVQAALAGTYSVALRLASAVADRKVALELDGRSIGSLTAPSSGWQAFETRTLAGVNIGAGAHELRVVFTDGSANLNFIEVTRTDTQPTGVRLPARIEAEDYTAYSDATAGNTGGACSRGDDVDKELTSDATGGQCNVGWMDVGERLDYAVFADAAGSFDVDLRVAGSGGSLRVELDGTSVGVSPTVNTGGWQTWTTLTVPSVAVSAGAHTLRVVVVAGGVNLNYLDVRARSAGGDQDGDRLPDAVETGTGIYVGPSNTGTSASNPDSDGDGLRDGDEVLGTEAGLNLPGMGVSPVHKDILIEYDWFDDATGCAYHSHQPTPEMMERVRQMFARAPVTNPDGRSGINLVQDVGQLGGGNFIADADGVLLGSVFSAEFQNYKSANMASNRLGYFHYTIFGHEYSDWPGSSGYAEIIGDDLIVTLGCLYSVTDYVANTIAHELGHNLNLWHGGNDGFNNKPNYNSVMNYRFQFAGIDTNCDSYGDNVLDYSVGANVSIDENNIDERAGVCGSTPIDFNFSGAIDWSVSYDINADNFNGVLSDHDDWRAIVYDWDASFGGARVARAMVDGVACPGPSEL
jgi:hypothetical protein